MASALNLTIPLKQDEHAQEMLRQMMATFTETVQKPLEKALAESKIVHFARMVLIEEDQRGRYLLVLTEFDGDPMAYTEFFRTNLGPIFEQLFSLAEGAPSWEELNSPEAFLEYNRSLNLRSMGTSADGDERHGYMFSAVGDKTVRELISQDGPTASGDVAAAAVAAA